jgi:hypothetical protein
MLTRCTELDPFSQAPPQAPPPQYSEFDTNTSANAKPPSPTPPQSFSFAVPPPAAVAGPSSLDNLDDEYRVLELWDIIFLIDDSGSMAADEDGHAIPLWSRKESRWDETRDILKTIAPICTKYDKNGISVYFMNNKNPEDEDQVGGGWHNIQKADQVHSLFAKVKPDGWTPTGMRIQNIMQPLVGDYCQRVERMNPLNYAGMKPVYLIVFTDGKASDDPESQIASLATQLDRAGRPVRPEHLYGPGAPARQFGIQFFQVGNDPTATKALQDMDDNMASTHGCRDMVDTVTCVRRNKGGRQPLTAELILKTLKGGMNAAEDRKKIA